MWLKRVGVFVRDGMNIIWIGVCVNDAGVSVVMFVGDFCFCFCFVFVIFVQIWIAWCLLWQKLINAHYFSPFSSFSLLSILSFTFATNSSKHHLPLSTSNLFSSWVYNSRDGQLYKLYYHLNTTGICIFSEQYGLICTVYNRYKQVSVAWTEKKFTICAHFCSIGARGC